MSQILRTKVVLCYQQSCLCVLADLLCWTMAYLLHMMSRLDSGQLAEQAQAVAGSILTKVKGCDVHTFHRLCGELVMALAGD